MSTLKRLWRNPFVRVLPLVLILAYAWQLYTNAGRGLSLPSKQNLLTDMVVSNSDLSGLPSGWNVNSSGQAKYAVAQTDGYTTETGSKITVSDYKNGDVTISTPKLKLESGKKYLFKGYYKSDMGFSLSAHYFYRDGTDELRFLSDYPNNKGVWSTVSDAFDSGDSITDVQYEYRATSDGTLDIDGTYLEPRNNVYIPPAPASSNNLVPNSQLVTDTFNMPVGWDPYRVGDNSADFTYQSDDKGPYLQLAVADYKNGEAKWQTTPIPVSPFRYYKFAVTYRSDTPADVVAEYTADDGTQHFDTLDTVQPSSEWTTISYPVQMPPSVHDMFISLVLHANGTMSTRNYSLVDMTKPGPLQWKRPVASITFDDGWKSSFNNALPLLNKYGYEATFYINPASIETPDFMSAADLQTLDDEGDEIAAHGYIHDDMTAVSAPRLDFDLREGRDYLSKAGFPTSDFATPYGKSDAEVQWYAREYFKTLRSTDSGINTRQSLDPYDLKVIYVENSTKNSDIQQALDQAKQTHGWVIFVYHRIGPAHETPALLKVESPAITTDHLTSQIGLIHSSGVTVEPIDKAYTELRTQ